MKEIIDFIAKRLVDDPDAVDVVEREEDGTVTVELRSAKDDLGKIIGKQGRTARAMRVVLATVAAKEDKRSRLEILE